LAGVDAAMENVTFFVADVAADVAGGDDTDGEFCEAGDEEDAAAMASAADFFA
jgi:hypothetical protein